MKTEGGFEAAVITFDSIDAMDVYRKTLWMEFIQGHAIKVMPMNLTREERADRNKYVAILSGFAPNIVGQDLVPLLNDINAKAILIPRQAFKYFQRPWAFVYFES